MSFREWTSIDVMSYNLEHLASPTDRFTDYYLDVYGLIEINHLTLTLISQEILEEPIIVNLILESNPRSLAT